MDLQAAKALFLLAVPSCGFLGFHTRWEGREGEQAFVGMGLKELPWLPLLKTSLWAKNVTRLVFTPREIPAASYAKRSFHSFEHVNLCVREI